MHGCNADITGKTAIASQESAQILHQNDRLFAEVHRTSFPSDQTGFNQSPSGLQRQDLSTPAYYSNATAALIYPNMRLNATQL